VKLVKFNVNTEFHNIPDEKYQKECEIMERLEDEDWEKYAKRLTSSRTKYQYVGVKISDEVSIPNWYYDKHKDDTVEVSISFSKYRSPDGSQMIPFDMKEAIRHGDVGDVEQTMKTVKRFELVRDLDKKTIS
jgi:hypothetical protein